MFMKNIGVILLSILMMVGCEDNSESESDYKFTDASIQGAYQIDDANSDISFKLIINKDHTGSITDEYEEDVTWIIKDDVLVITFSAIAIVYYFDLVEGTLNNGEFSIKIDYENDSEIDKTINGRFVRVDNKNNSDSGEGEVIIPSIQGNKFLVDIEHFRFVLTLNADSTGNLKGYPSRDENGIPFTWVFEEGVYIATTTDDTDFYGLMNYRFYFESGDFNNGTIAFTFDYVDDNTDDTTHEGSQIRNLDNLITYNNLSNKKVVITSDDNDQPELTYIFTDQAVEYDSDYYIATDNTGALYYWTVATITTIIIVKVDQSEPADLSIESITTLSLTAGSVQQGAVSVAITSDTANSFDANYTASFESTAP